MKGPMITVNWRGRKNVRGLAELAEETLRSVGIKIKKDELVSKADELHDNYKKAKFVKTTDRRMLNVFSFEKELALVQRYVKVVL